MKRSRFAFQATVPNHRFDPDPFTASLRSAVSGRSSGTLAAMVRAIPFGVLEKARINYDYAKK